MEWKLVVPVRSVRLFLTLVDIRWRVKDACALGDEDSDACPL